MIYVRTRIRPEEWDAQNSRWCWDTNRSPNTGQKSKPNNNKQTKKKKKKRNTRICRIVDFAVPADYRVKVKDSENRDKYINLAKELKKLWYKNIVVIPIVIGALGTAPKGLERGLQELKIRGRIKTIQTTTLLRSAWILRVREIWWDLLSLKLQW